MKNEYDIEDIVRSKIRYREPWKYEGKYFDIKLGKKKFGCIIDHKTLGYINEILENPIEKRKFPRMSDYIKYCIIKWTKIYLQKTKKEYHIFPIFNSKSIINDKTLSIIMHRFELDFVDLKHILSSSEYSKKDRLIKFRDQFIRHLNMVLSLPTTNMDIGDIRHYITNDTTISYIVDILEREELAQKGYIGTIQFKKNDTKFPIERNIELIDIIISHIEVNKTEEEILTNTIYKIIFEENENIPNEENRKFVIFSDYIFMCIKEWTNIYRIIYHNHPLNYRYILDLENERSICNNYINAIREDRTLIPNFSDFHAEINLNKWFIKNYKVFGFTDASIHNTGGIDYLCKYDSDRYFYIGLEYESGNFILHGHDPNTVDIVICYKKDKDLSIPIIPIFELSKEI